MRTARPQNCLCCECVALSQQNPHMRAFWASTISFFLAFLGWFALAPLGLEVATSMGQCENQLYPPASNPTRPAYLKYKNLKSGLTYCQYGTVKNSDGKLTDCQPVPADKLTGDRRGADAVPTWGVGQMRLHNRNWLQRHNCKCRGGSSGIHHLCSHCTWHIAGAIWSCERAIRPADLWSFLGGHGGGHFSSMELHLDPILHWLCRSYLCDQSVLVFAHVFAQCGRHCQCHCSRLGQLGWWCDTDLHDLRAVQSHGEFRHGGWHGLASVHDRPCGPFPDLCCHHEALVLGHSQCQALRCGCDWQDPEAILVGLCGGPERCSRACDDFSVLCLFRDRAGYEQPAGNPLQDLLPNGCSRRLIIGRSFWIDEPLCPLAWRNHQWYPLQVLWFPWSHLGTVFSTFLRGNLPVWLRFRGQHPAMVRCFGCTHLLLPLRADGRRNKLWNCAFHEQTAAGCGVCIGWGRRKLGSCDCWILLLQTHWGWAASLQGPCRICDVLGAVVSMLLLEGAWWHVPWTSCFREVPDRWEDSWWDCDFRFVMCALETSNLA